MAEEVARLKEAAARGAARSPLSIRCRDDGARVAARLPVRLGRRHHAGAKALSRREMELERELGVFAGGRRRRRRRLRTRRMRGGGCEIAGLLAAAKLSLTRVSPSLMSWPPPRQPRGRRRFPTSH